MEIIKFLARKNITQAELAKLIDTSPANVTRWVKGDGTPSFELCFKLLELGMTQEELFGIPPHAEHLQIKSIAEFLDVFQKVMNSTIDGIRKEL